jgi:2,3-bisphosphoglycerate-independent phosphoglycerate mutase
MRYAVVIPDGAADTPRPELHGRTPLEAAAMPTLCEMARTGQVLCAATVPEGMKPGSDVACLSVLGYNPGEVYTGRAPLEAAAMDIRLGEGEAVFRANLVTVEDGTMVDYAGGHISTPDATELVDFLDASLGIEGVRLHPGKQYRHACVVPGAAGETGATTPPHDILDQPADPHLPREGVSDLLRRIMDRSAELLVDYPGNRDSIAAGKRPITQLWLWGGGTMPVLPAYQARFGVSGAIISAVDLLRGIGRLSGLEVIDVPGATGYYDTDYAAKGRAALEALQRLDFVVVHVEAPDEAGHNAETDQKVKALERIDEHILAPLKREAEGFEGGLRILTMPDHPTPIELRTHTSDPVPACIWGSGVEPSGPDAFSERLAADAGLCRPGHEMVDLLFR